MRSTAATATSTVTKSRARASRRLSPLYALALSADITQAQARAGQRFADSYNSTFGRIATSDLTRPMVDGGSGARAGERRSASFEDWQAACLALDGPGKRLEGRAPSDMLIAFTVHERGFKALAGFEPGMTDRKAKDTIVKMLGTLADHYSGRNKQV